jgi:GNAT superfamily N-acetyltransferase
MQLPDGHHDVPAGKLAMIVTSLAMTAPPPTRPDPVPAPWRLERVEVPEPEAYRALYRRVGQDWLWFSRLRMTDAALLAILRDPDVAVYRLVAATGEAGLLELDFREAGSCELSFFGLVPELIGGGAGRWLMNRALDLAWARPIGRFWVHTCTLDHPKALDFYIRSGFDPTGRQVEIADDPRANGILPREVAPQIPLL